jgi:hypothetical protein
MRRRGVIDDRHIAADMDGLSLAQRIIAGQIDCDGFALLGHAERTHVAKQRLAGLRREYLDVLVKLLWVRTLPSTNCFKLYGFYSAADAADWITATRR